MNLGSQEFCDISNYTHINYSQVFYCLRTVLFIHNNMHHNAELFKLAPWKWCGCLSLLFLTTHHESCQYIFFWPYSLDFIHMTDYSSQLIILHCYLEDKEINEFYFSWWKEEDIYMTLGNCLLNGEKTFKFIMDMYLTHLFRWNITYNYAKHFDVWHKKSKGYEFN